MFFNDTATPEIYTLSLHDALPISPARTEALANALMRSFGLTPAETRLALKLQVGLTLAECGRDLDISVNTARNQLRAIFDKLGLRRQSGLARTLAQLAALAGG